MGTSFSFTETLNRAVQECGRRLNQSHFRPMAEVSFLPSANTRKRASASREGPVKDDRKITSQMKVHLKLIWLAQKPLNKNRGCSFVKTKKNYLRIPLKCSHILYDIVGYHNKRQTLVANTLNFSYVCVETVLLCRTINRQSNCIGINFAMNKWQKLYVHKACTY